MDDTPSGGDRPVDSAGEDGSLGGPRNPGHPDRRSPSWTLLSKEELVDAYWNHIAPVYRADGHDPSAERPSHEWLRDNGFRGLVYALRKYHDRTFSEFWMEDLDLEVENNYRWGIADEGTVSSFREFLDTREHRRNWSDGTVRTVRYRLARYARAYEDVTDGKSVVNSVDPDDKVSPVGAVDACWSAFDLLDENLDRRTLRRVHEAVSDYYEYLVRRRRAEFNPASGLDEEYAWTVEDGESDEATNPALGPDHVAALAAEASALRDRLLVVALCGWGLRRSEVASLHRSQVNFVNGDDHIAFKDRKNGPGTVAMIVGCDLVERRMAEFDDDVWNGYLFPSDRSSTGHVTGQTIRNWFADLVEAAPVPSRIGGRKPTPQMARRFWYDAYTATLDDVLEEVQAIAAEQGSTSPSVIWSNYLSEERKRDLRRQFMRTRIAEALKHG